MSSYDHDLDLAMEEHFFPDDLLTVGQAAALARVSRVAVGQWIRTGRLKAETLPPRGVWRYVRRSDLEALIASERVRKRLRRRKGGER